LAAAEQREQRRSLVRFVDGGAIGVHHVDGTGDRCGRWPSRRWPGESRCRRSDRRDACMHAPAGRGGVDRGSAAVTP
jgi:hypothetical protein